jgi:DsbC/DsbD-like thiol-disulfide interchange protein
MASFVVAMAWVVCADAQTTRPRASLQPATSEVTLAPGASADLVLTVSMPPDVHIQAHQPKDRLLIPTVLTVEAPDGVKVESIAYPSPTEFAQAGRTEPLLVLGPAFEIRVRLAVGNDAVDGVRSIPVVLRYQACNDTVCFPPARATAAWTISVASPPRGRIADW